MVIGTLANSKRSLIFSILSHSLIALCLASLGVVAVAPKKAGASEVSSVVWNNAPATLQKGASALFSFTVSGNSGGTLSLGSCTLTAVYSTSQSFPALQGSGSVNGKKVTVEYGSAGMAGLFHETVSLPANFSLSLTHSSEATPAPGGKVTIEYSVMCGGVTSEKKTVTVKDVSNNLAQETESPQENEENQGEKAEIQQKTEEPDNAPTKHTTPALPEKFLLPNSHSTDLTKVRDLSAVDGFTLDIPQKGMIEFATPADLSKVKMEDLERFIDLNTVGEVTINSAELPQLNLPAKITMRGLSFETTPEILKDGKPAGNAVKNISYEKGAGLLTFEVVGFSTYKAVSSQQAQTGGKQENPKSGGVGTPKSNTENAEMSKETGDDLVSAGVFVLAVILAVAIGAGLWIKKAFLRKRKNVPQEEAENKEGKQDRQNQTASGNQDQPNNSKSGLKSNATPSASITTPPTTRQ